MSTLAHTLPQTQAAGATISFAKPAAVIARFAKSVWRSLEQMGFRRARRVMLTMAHQYESTQPEVAAQLREAANYNHWQ